MDKDSLSPESFRIAVESAMNHIIITNTDGKILFANQAVTENTGFGHNEVIGNNPRLWGKQMSKDFYENMWDIIKNKKQPFYGEIINKRKNGQLYTARMVISPIIENKQLIGFIGTEDDITEEINEEKIIHEKMGELEKLNQLMMGRALKMVELKEQIKDLQLKLQNKG